MTSSASPSDPSQLPAIAGAPLSLVLPAYNASGCLLTVLADWSAFLDGLARDYEILLVDDGSTDDTVAQAESRPQARLHVFRHAQRRGFGAALRTGIDAARYPLLCYCPCDRQYQPRDLKQLLDIIDKVDLATGCRHWRPLPGWLWVLGGLWHGLLRLLFGAPWPARHGWLGWHGFGRRLVARWIFGVRVHDPECSFRLFRRAIFARIPIQSDGAFAQVEILAKANFLGKLMTEEPVSYSPPDQPEEAVDSPAREKLRSETWRLFNDPDFGPPVLPKDSAEGLPAPPSPLSLAPAPGPAKPPGPASSP
jgi:dolichol-phosphate mannosyltransferase